MPSKTSTCLSGNAKYLWRQRWILAVIVLSFIGIFVIINTMGGTPVAFHDTYTDDVSPEILDYVKREWYNYQGPQGWYNKENISMFKEELLETMREHWIIRGYKNDTNQSIDVDVEDPSMGQAQVIRTIFQDRKNGFFIECGAYDGFTRSNTWILEKALNWTGILIEADPINFSKMLNQNRRAYLSPTCLSTSSRPMNVSFLMAKNIGRIHVPHDEDDADENTMDRAHHGEHVGVQCFPLASYIAALDVKTVNYFSLDVEGNEMEILQTIPFDLVDIQTLSVEYSHVDAGKEKMIKFMSEKGYYVHSFVNHEDNLANDIIFIKRKADEDRLLTGR